MELKRINQASLVTKAIRLGARPPVVMDLFPSFNAAQIKRMYREIMGYDAPRGPIATTVSLLFRDRASRYQSSQIVSMFSKLVEEGFSKPEALLASYEAYTKKYPVELQKISIDHARVLSKKFLERNLHMHRCRRCESVYLHDPDRPLLTDDCHICGPTAVVLEEVALHHQYRNKKAVC